MGANKMIETKKETHWYYFGERINSFGRVMTACGKLVHSRNDIDLINPSCKDCKEKMDHYNDAVIE